jgi:GNAT superfamily N-acetyltransferase
MLPSEAAAVSLLAREVFIQFVAAQYEAEGVEEFGRYESAEAFSQRQEPDHVSLVAERDGELIGMLQLRESSHVAMLFIRPSCQRQGIGRALLAAASALVGDPDRAFTVSASPNAVTAYERLGFTPTAPEQLLRGIRYVPMQRLPHTRV